MKTNNSKKRKTKSIITTTIATLSLAGAMAFIFNNFTEVAMAAELDRVVNVSTNYQVMGLSSQQTKKQEPLKMDYRVLQDSLAEGTPDTKDLSMEQAAELGAKLLNELYDVDLTGADIYMGYDSETYSRSYWSGDVRFGERTPENPGYGFNIDAVTGECYALFYTRYLDVEVPLGPDYSLEEDPSEFIDYAMEQATKYNLVHGQVLSGEVTGQGYQCNDPDISIMVYGANGEKASLGFSRYDKTLLSVTYDIYERLSDELMEKRQKEYEQIEYEAFKKAEEQGGSYTYDGAYGKYGFQIMDAN